MADRTAKNLIEYTLFLIMVGVVRLLPRKAALALGAGLGRLARRLQPRRVRIARENLAAAFPQMPEKKMNATIAEIFGHLGKSGIELLLLNRLRTRADLDRHISVTGLEHLQEAFDRGKGVFILTGHVGFWEVGTFLLPILGYPVDFVAKRMKNPYIDDYVRRLREAAGGRVLDAKHGARRIMKALSENRAVALLLDQHTTPHRAVQVPFFGRPAWTTPIIAQIAMKQGVPVVPSFSLRLPDGRYQVEFQKPLLLSGSSGPEAVSANTALLTEKIEAAVRRDISQWFWVHRRWRE
jgi:KDO2-lipid IV(A) lauroyltransferase